MEKMISFNCDGCGKKIQASKDDIDYELIRRRWFTLKRTDNTVLHYCPDCYEEDYFRTSITLLR